jgi:hypothetical protein
VGVLLQTTTTTIPHEDDWEPKLIFISIYTCHQLASPVGEQMREYNPEFVREATAKDISGGGHLLHDAVIFLLPAEGLESWRAPLRMYIST